ncbi:MAG: Fur family transcriptional regulator [Bacteroidota bacterium]
MQQFVEKISEAGLKITPQRVAVAQALNDLKHPTVEEIFSVVIKTIPGLSLATVYNVLDVFISKGIVEKVKNDSDKMRYDLITQHHHHIYDNQSNRVEDYFDPDLDLLLQKYFEQKKIKGFKLKQVKLQIMGEFDDITVNNT